MTTTLSQNRLQATPLNNPVLIPDDNERELSEVPDNVKADLNIIPVKWIDQVIKVAFA